MRQVQSQKKKLSVVAGIFLIFLIIIGDFTAGFIGIIGIGTGEAQSYQKGSFTANFPGDGGCPQSAFTCTPELILTITFPKPFKSVPYVTLQRNFTISAQVLQFNYYFQSVPTPTAWTNMPLAVTEIYGNSNNEQIFEFNNEGQHRCGLFVNVVTPGVTGSFLRIQDSLDQITWTNFLQPVTSTGADVPISAAGIQSGQDGQAWYQTQTLPSPFYRIMGFGGNGIASPSFTQIYLSCVDYVPGVFDSVQNVTPTNFQALIFMLIPPDNGRQFPYSWSAVTCTNKASIC